MYNRYIPGQNGVYERRIVQDKPAPIPVVSEPAAEPCIAEPVIESRAPEPEPCPPQAAQRGSFLQRHLPKNLDTGDLLVILILALLLLDGDESDSTSLILTAVAFAFL